MHERIVYLVTAYLDSLWEEEEIQKYIFIIAFWLLFFQRHNENSEKGKQLKWEHTVYSIVFCYNFIDVHSTDYWLYTFCPTISNMQNFTMNAANEIHV